MSVTFAPDLDLSNAPYGVACACGAVKSAVVYPSYADAYAAVFVLQSVVAPVCGDDHCAAYSTRLVLNVDLPEVNVSNYNAKDILDLLGYRVEEDFSERCAGSLTAEDFLGRLLVAEAINPSDEGIPATTEGIVTHCGRPVGYMEARISELRSVVEYAKEKNVGIYWS